MLERMGYGQPYYARAEYKGEGDHVVLYAARRDGEIVWTDDKAEAVSWFEERIAACAARLARAPLVNAKSITLRQFLEG